MTLDSPSQKNSHVVKSWPLLRKQKDRNFTMMWSSIVAVVAILVSVSLTFVYRRFGAGGTPFPDNFSALGPALVPSSKVEVVAELPYPPGTYLFLSLFVSFCLSVLP
jgi:hypothetical protein